MDENPHRILFDQSWSNGTYSDYGGKMLKVGEEDGRLVIIEEEMLQSILTQTTTDVNNALADHRFFKREGNYIPMPIEFSKSESLYQKKRCNTRWGEEFCIQETVHSIDTLNTNTPLDTLLAKNIFVGDIYSDSIQSFTITEWRATSKAILDSLPGITYEGSIFERDYFWVGGYETETEFAPALYFGDYELPVKQGQWVFISDEKPVVYQKIEISEERKEVFLSQSLKNSEHPEYYSLDYYENGPDKFLVTYKEEFECGDPFYSDIKLWGFQGESLRQIKELPDLPVSILNINGDDKLDMLYTSDFNEDPSIYIWYYAPNYEKRGDDTVFLTCGC